MSLTELAPDHLATEAFAGWLERFGAGLEAHDVARIMECFADESYWKDVLAFTWGYRTFHDAGEIAPAFERCLPRVRPRAVRIAAGRTPPRLVRRASREVVEAFFDFDTDIGRGTGFVRVQPDRAALCQSKAWIVLTTLQDVRGFEEKVRDRRPTGVEYSTNFAGDNWLDIRNRARSFEDREPQVLIVGGGQAGLILGARLGQMGVDTLIVERLPHVGDNWRNRYHSLTLHNEVWANSLPYLPFPDTWPTFVPKDKLAGWLEAYAEAMELNVWTGTEFVGGEYDAEGKVWTARLRGADGTERTMRPAHVVLAVGGVSGVPHVPALPGIETFGGEVMHSSQFSSGIPYAGRHAIVVGTGNSGHDVAQDLHSNGAAQVTMIQRSPTTVVSLVPSGTMVYAIYSEGPPPDDVDLITASVPFEVLRDTYQWLTRKTSALDHDLLSGLDAVGFRTDSGPDDTGFHMRYLRQGGGYYINVGCAELIADRKIGVVDASAIDTFTPDGVLLRDGTTVPAEVVVLATGYENLQEGIRRMLGDEIADRVGPVWGFDENHIMKNMWQQTAQPHFWLMGGSLVDCRLYSKFLAVQIRADLAGLLPDRSVIG